MGQFHKTKVDLPSQKPVELPREVLQSIVRVSWQLAGGWIGIDKHTHRHICIF